MDCLQIDAEAVMITSMAPARKRGYLILQIRETSGKNATLELKRDGKTLRFRKADALENTYGRRLKRLALNPYDDVFVIVRARQ